LTMADLRRAQIGMTNLLQVEKRRPDHEAHCRRYQTLQAG
jgi:hypothetical protein